MKLYAWPTPNGRKIPILLEELELAYEIMPVNIGAGEQFSPEFLELSPNNKIPALLDDDGPEPLALFESGAILTYLADKYGRFLAPGGPARWRAQQWLFWQVGGLGPMLGQAAFFARFSEEKLPLAIKRFLSEVERLFGVLERQLAANTFLAGEEYTIADIACYPWVAGALSMPGDVFTSQFAGKPALDRWLRTVGNRPAVARGMAYVAPATG